MQSPKWKQIGKLILSFATFCFVFPHAFEDFGKEEPVKNVEPEAKPLAAR